MNAIHENWKRLEVAPPRYVSEPCIFCVAGRQWTTYMNGAEHAEICRQCNGRGLITVERPQ